MMHVIKGLVRPSKHGFFDVYNGVLSLDGSFQDKLGKYKGKRVTITIEEDELK